MSIKIDKQMRAALTKALSKRAKRKKAPQASTKVHNIGYSSGISLWPPKYRAKLRYKKIYTMSAGAPDIWNNITFMTNSIYDPYVPVGGGNPKGYTDLAAHYAHYMVLGCKVHVQVVLRAGNATMIALSNTEDVTHTNLVGREDRINDERTKYVVVHNDRPIATLTSYYSKAKVFGTATNQKLSAPMASNPDEEYFALIGSMQLGAGIATSTVDIIVTLEYDTLCYEKLDTPNN